MVNLFSSRAPHIHILPQFCNDSACRLVCQRRWYSALISKASSMVNLLSDDTSDGIERLYCVILRTNRARCALNKILDLLNEESISVVELVYKFDENLTANVWKGELIAKVRFKFILVHIHLYLRNVYICIYIYGHQHQSLYPARASRAG